MENNKNAVCPICGNEIIMSKEDYACTDINCPLYNGANDILKRIISVFNPLKDKNELIPLAKIDHNETFMLKVEDKDFRCNCGCNVFHHKYTNKNVYTCNLCHSDYESY